MIMKKIVLNLIILVSIIYLSSYLFASCTLGIPSTGVVIAGDPSITSTTAIFDVMQVGPFIQDDLVFTHTGCTGLSVYVRFDSNLSFEIKGAKSDLNISGVDGVILDNTNIIIKDTSFQINSKGNHASLNSPTKDELLSYFYFDVNEIIVNGNSSIKYLEDSSNQVCIWINSKIKLKFNNLLIYENATLDLQVIAGDHSRYELAQPEPESYWCGHAFQDEWINKYFVDMINGSHAVLEGKNILNEGTLNLTINGGDGYRGYIPPKGESSWEAFWKQGLGGALGNLFLGLPFLQAANIINININIINSSPNGGWIGGFGGFGGDAIFDINKIDNSGTITNLDITGGGAGRGGTGSESGGPSVFEGRGGDGGIGGASIININNGIYNFSDSALMNLNLLAGDGGRGGDSGFDHGEYNGNYCFGTNQNQIENQCGGWGGPGGNIFISKFGTLFNQGTINISITAGNGSNGGEKVNHECYGLNGNGGNAGNIYGTDIGLQNDIDIINLINNGSLNLTLKSGIDGNGIFDGCYDLEKNGDLGSIARLDINYFDNQTKEGLIILKDTQLTEERYANYNSNINSQSEFLHYDINSYIPYPEDIIIRNLKSGSYTPEKIEINQYDMLLRDRKIVLAGCSVNENSEVTLKSKENYIIVSNPYGFTVNATPNPFLKFNENCIPCDNSNLLGADRISDVYSIYSTIEGTIDSRDLNIYYTDSNGGILPLNNPFFANKPLYTNLWQITGVFDKKTGLYKYEIIPENLLWYDNPEYKDDYTLSPGDAPYCAGQQYFIEGEIDGLPFDFPFIPLFKSS